MAILFPLSTWAQCPGFPGVVPDEDCANYPSLVNNANINSNQVRSICATDTGIVVRNNINLNGGTIRICGNARISGNFNSGLIIVACGSTLEFPSGFLLNNDVGIMNYGTVRVTGNLVMQNSNNIFYNASPTARLFVSGNLLFSQNPNQTGYFKNEGYAKIGGSISALSGALLCLNGGSIVDCTDFTYGNNCGEGANNRVTYSGGTGPAILRFQNQATLKGTVTASSNIHVWRAIGANTEFLSCGSWGNAVVIPNAPAIPVPGPPDRATCNPQNCFTTISLPILLSSFEVYLRGEEAVLNWTTEWETNMAFFSVERSVDGRNWENLLDVPGQIQSVVRQRYQAVDPAPVLGTSFYRLRQTDRDGTSTLSELRTLEWDGVRRDQFSLFPNPARSTIRLEGSRDLGFVKVYNATGQLLKALPPSSTLGASAELSIEELPMGIYFVQTGLGVQRLVKTN